MGKGATLQLAIELGQCGVWPASQASQKSKFEQICCKQIQVSFSLPTQVKNATMLSARARACKHLILQGPTAIHCGVHLVGVPTNVSSDRPWMENRASSIQSFQSLAN